MSQTPPQQGCDTIPQKLKSSTRGLLGNTLVYSASNILNAAIPFVLLPMLTRVLPPSDYGVIAMYTAVLGFISPFTGLGSDSAVNVRYVCQERIDFPRYVGSSLYVLLGSTLATLSLVAIISSPLSRFTSIPPFWLLIAVLAAACNFICNMRLGLWIMSKKSDAYGVFQVSMSAVNMGLSLILVFSMNQGYAGRLWGQALAMALFAVIGLYSLIRAKQVSFVPKWEYIRDALGYGVPLVPHVIGICLISIADRFIINRQLGLSQAGIYMIAVQLGMALYVLSDAFNKAFIPWLFGELKINNHETMKMIVRKTWQYFMVALLLAGGVAILSYWIVLLVAGKKYIDAAGALAWQALGQAFLGMYLMVSNYIFYVGKTRVLAVATVLSGCLGLALTWILVPVFGISGAGFSFAITMLTRFLLTWFLAQRVCPMPWFCFWKRTEMQVLDQ